MAGDSEQILAEAIIQGLISYESVYSPESWINDDDVDRIKEYLSVISLRDLAQLTEPTSK